MTEVLARVREVVDASPLPVIADADTGYMVQKLRAALDTRRDMLIIARTDARGRAGLDEAIRRAQLYAEAGVDLVFVEAPVSLQRRATSSTRRVLPLPPAPVVRDSLASFGEREQVVDLEGWSDLEMRYAHE